MLAIYLLYVGKQGESEKILMYLGMVVKEAEEPERNHGAKMRSGRMQEQKRNTAKEDSERKAAARELQDGDGHQRSRSHECASS